MSNEPLILYKRNVIDTPWHFVFSKNNHKECPKLEKTVHWHDYYEFELIVSGNANHLLNNESIPIRKRSAYFLTPFDFHTIHPIENDYTVSYCFNFDTYALDDEIFQIITQLNKTLYLDLNEYDFNSIIDDISLLENKLNKPNTPAKTLLFKNTFSKIILTFINAFPKTTSAESTNIPTNAFQQAIAYTNLHFREPISLISLADTVGLTPNYLGQLFKKQYNKSYSEFLLTLRLNYAKNLLKHTDDTVAHIAKKSGFNTTSYFIKCFTKFYNITPKNYSSIGTTMTIFTNDNKNK